VLISLFGSQYSGYYIIDSAVAVAIVAYIFRSSLQIGRQAFNNLMDHELVDGTAETVEQILSSNSNALALPYKYCAVRTRMSGRVRFVYFSLNFNSQAKMQDCTAVLQALQAQMAAKIEHCQVIANFDLVC
jgi:divalent metal cation (Fe/Co/Zn/Cd) transporter